MMIALQSLISLALLLLIMVLYNQYRVDLLRHELFSVRDDLFDQAAAGRLSFEGPAYGELRTMLNGMIRFAHTISLLEFIAFQLLVPAKSEEFARAKLTSFVTSLPDGEQQLAQSYMERAHVCVVKHLFRSPWMLVTVVPAIVVFVLTKAGFDLAAIAVRRFSRQLASLDSLAIGEGRKSTGFAETNSRFA